MKEQEEKAKELAKEILKDQRPDFEYDEIGVQQLSGAPVFDVIFMKHPEWVKVQVEVTE